MEITKKHVRSVTCTIGGALEHQKVKNQQKLKCTKNTLLICQILALSELFPMSTILVLTLVLGGALEHQKVKNQQKFRCT